VPPAMERLEDSHLPVTVRRSAHIDLDLQILLCLLRSLSRALTLLQLLLD